MVRISQVEKKEQAHWYARNRDDDGEDQLIDDANHNGSNDDFSVQLNHSYNTQVRSQQSDLEPEKCETVDWTAKVLNLRVYSLHVSFILTSLAISEDSPC